MYFASGCNVAGLSICPAIGEALAKWIIEVSPHVSRNVPQTVTRANTGHVIARLMLPDAESIAEIALAVAPSEDDRDL